MKKNILISILCVAVIVLVAVVWQQRNFIENNVDHNIGRDVRSVTQDGAGTSNTGDKTATNEALDMVSVVNKQLSISTDESRQHQGMILPKVSFAYPKNNWTIFDKTSSAYTNLELTKIDPENHNPYGEGWDGFAMNFGVGFVPNDQIASHYEEKCATSHCPISITKKVTTDGIPFTVYIDTINKSIMRVVYEVKPNLQVFLEIDNELSSQTFRSETESELTAIIQGMHFLI